MHKYTMIDMKLAAILMHQALQCLKSIPNAWYMILAVAVARF